METVVPDYVQAESVTGLVIVGCLTVFGSTDCLRYLVTLKSVVVINWCTRRQNLLNPSRVEVMNGG
jgi:hypothetical protein